MVICENEDNYKYCERKFKGLGCYVNCMNVCKNCYYYLRHRNKLKDKIK